MNAAGRGMLVLNIRMSDIDTINHIVSTTSPLLQEVRGPIEKPHLPGVLVIGGHDKRTAVHLLQQSAKKRRDVRVDSLIEAYRQLLTQRFDLVLILPDASEATQDLVLARLRGLASGAPVLVLSETAAPGSSEAGSKEAQQEIVAPAQEGEELARRQIAAAGPIIGYRASGMITVNGEAINLSPSLSRIMWRLLEAPQHCCKTSELIEAMTNPNLTNVRDTLRVHISRLRRVLAAAGCDGTLVAGRGVYWLREPRRS